MSHILLDESAAPAAPAAGKSIIYPKADGLWYSKDDAGVETLMSGGAGGGAGSFTEQTTTATGAQNNFSLGQSKTYLRCTGAAPDFTGFTIGGVAPAAGDEVILEMLGTTSLKVSHQGGGSTAAHRAIFPSVAGQIVGVGGRMHLIYDDTTDRWRGALINCGAAISPAFSAGDYTGAGAMTLTVDAGDVTTYCFMQRGKMVKVQVVFDAASVGGTLNSKLFVAIPGGFVVTRRVVTIGLVNDNGTYSASWVDVIAADTKVGFYKVPMGGNWAASTNLSGGFFEIEFDVD